MKDPWYGFILLDRTFLSVMEAARGLVYIMAVKTQLPCSICFLFLGCTFYLAGQRSEDLAYTLAICFSSLISPHTRPPSQPPPSQCQAAVVAAGSQHPVHWQAPGEPTGMQEWLDHWCISAQGAAQSLPPYIKQGLSVGGGFSRGGTLTPALLCINPSLRGIPLTVRETQRPL